MDESKFQLFDAAEYLDSEEAIAEYISEAMQDPNPDALLEALATVARARGMAKLAESTGLGRESLYKTLRPGAKPRYETIANADKKAILRSRLPSYRALTFPLPYGVGRGGGLRYGRNMCSMWQKVRWAIGISKCR